MKSWEEAWDEQSWDTDMPAQEIYRLGWDAREAETNEPKGGQR